LKPVIDRRALGQSDRILVMTTNVE